MLMRARYRDYLRHFPRALQRHKPKINQQSEYQGYQHTGPEVGDFLAVDKIVVHQSVSVPR